MPVFIESFVLAPVVLGRTPSPEGDSVHVPPSSKNSGLTKPKGAGRMGSRQGNFGQGGGRRGDSVQDFYVLSFRLG